MSLKPEANSSFSLNEKFIGGGNKPSLERIKREMQGKNRSKYIAVGVSVFLLVFFCLVLYVMFALLIIFGIFSSQQPELLSYREDDQLIYAVSGTIIAVGSENVEQKFQIESTLKIHCIKKDSAQKTYVMSMNMYNTNIYNCPEFSDKQLIASVEGAYGETVFFNQTYKGQILEIIKPDENHDSFAMKINLVNALQTYITNNEQITFDATPGVFTVTPTSSYNLVTRVIKLKADETDFDEFIDNNVMQYRENEMFKYTNEATHYLNNDGKFSKIILYQESTLTKNEENGKMHSNGELVLNLIGHKIVSSDDDPYGRRETSLKSHLKQHGTRLIRKMEEEKDDYERRSEVFNTEKRAIENVVSGNLASIASSLMDDFKLLTKSDPYVFIDKHIRIIEEISDLEDEDNRESILYSARRVVESLKKGDDNFLRSAFINGIFDGTYSLFNSMDNNHKNVMLYILVNHGSFGAQQFLISEGLSHSSSDVRFLAILNAIDLIEPYKIVTNKLLEISENEEEDQKNRDSALLCYAILLGRLVDERRDSGESIILSKLDKIIEKMENSESVEFSKITNILHAMKNAKIEISDDKFDKIVYLTQDPYIKKIALPLLNEKSSNRRSVNDLQNGELPFNQKNIHQKDIGKAYCKATYYTEYEISSNYECSDEDKQNFNYSSSIEVYGDGYVLGTEYRSFFLGNMYYKRLENEIVHEHSIYIWDDVVSSGKLEEKDCSSATQSVFHVSSGDSIEFSVVIAFAPVTFSVWVDAIIDMSYDYLVCEDLKNINFKLTPWTSLIFHGSTTIQFLPLKGGIQSDGSIAVQLIPLVYVSGEMCEAGVEIQRIINPLNEASYLNWKSLTCPKKFPFQLSCGWGDNTEYKIWNFEPKTENKIISSIEWDLKNKKVN